MIIINKKLGFKITYFLSRFSRTKKQTSYAGKYLFAEDTAGLKPSKLKQVLKERDETYAGSRMHFIRSLWADNLRKDAFTIFPPSTSYADSAEYDHTGKVKIKKLGYNQVVTVKNANTPKQQKYITLKTEVYINRKLKKNAEDSFLKQSPAYLGVFIDGNGYYGDGLEWKGKMGEHRVNKLLPFEFQPSK